MSKNDNSNNKKIERRFDIWKKQLLDLTRKNRLLYFTTKRTSAFRITQPSIKEIVIDIIERGASLKFPVPSKKDQLLLPNAGLNNSHEKSDIKIRKGDIETEVDAIDLQSRLYRLMRDFITWQEEQGIHTLFLAIGMLHWRESNQEKEECLSPLLLIPVTLSKESLDKPYCLKYAEDDVIVNPALCFKLEMDFDVHLPELPEELDAEAISNYLKSIKPIAQSSKWYITEEVWLGKFYFEKFVMYEDLKRIQDIARNHSIVRALSSVESPSIPADIPELKNLDNSIKAEEVFPVLDADESQTEVLVRASKGQNLVVKGPPGTGKSQTIVNLIAQSLRDGKRVLFVSEKMAALEVVYRRLKELGLAHACLEVHSHRSNKAKVIEELGRTLRTSSEPISPSDSLERFRRLCTLRNKLNQYVRELHKRRGKLRRTAFQIHAFLSNLSKCPDVAFDISSPLAVDSEDLEKFRDAIAELSQLPNVINRYETHPWLNAQFEVSSYSRSQKEEILKSVKTLLSVCDIVIEKSKKWEENLAIKLRGLSFVTIIQFSKLLNCLSKPPDIFSSWLELDNNNIELFKKNAISAEVHSNDLKTSRTKLSVCFSNEILKQPINDIYQRLYKKYRSIGRYFRIGYWREINALKKFLINGTWFLSYSKALSGLESACKVKEEEHWFEKHEFEHERKFGNLYQREETDWQKIIRGLEWVSKVINYFSKLGIRMNKQFIELCANQKTISSISKEIISELNEIMIYADKPYKLILGKVFRNYSLNGQTLDETEFEKLKSWLSNKDNPQDIDDWVAFLKLRKQIENAGLLPFLENAIKKNIKANELENAFLKRFWNLWLDEVYKEAPVLGDFSRAGHEHIVNEFREIDSKLKGVTAGMIADIVKQKQPKIGSEHVNSSQVGILLREVNKKKRHKPLRKLFSQIPHLLQNLKPCFLMSPLSVASYLTPNGFNFDIAIFDEASQMPPEDAIGSIVRAKQVIVAGDEKQLPPTRFFQTESEWEEEGSEDEEPLESILDECSSLQSFAQTPLLWHYRSKHEELIAFSNRKYYENSLVTFPSPNVSGNSSAVRFIKCNGIYDYGGSRTNRQEAKSVVDLVIEHFKQYPERTLGVITLSLAQEEAILTEWEKRKMEEPHLGHMIEKSEEEPFFIKALEKVQGDERDDIILSIGYGPDQNGQIHLNFGPINRSGGERRLNVAVTRARIQTTVIASFEPHQLDLARLTTQNRGVIHLQEYLEYSKNCGRFPVEATSKGSTETEFEESVKRILENHGLKIDSQVGYSGFRIDLAVRHPDYESRYILGIECDGATYHSHKTARDRDRLRQEVLESLGWKLYRIWSTDWIKNPEPIVEEILLLIRKLRKGEVIGPSAPPSKNSVNRNSTDKKKEQYPNQKPAETLHLPKYSPSFYTQFPEKKKHPPKWLYEAERLDYYRKYLKNHILEIVEMESPVHIQAVTRRIASIYGFERSGERIQEIVEECVKDLSSEIKFKDGFLYDSKNYKDVFRVPRDGEPPRPIHEVPLEEIAAAGKYILESEKGMPHLALIQTIAHLMGYDRTGVNVKERIEQAIKFMQTNGTIKLYEDQIILSISP